MKLRIAAFLSFLTLAACALSGCASAPQNVAQASVDEVKIYGSDQLAPSRYEVVRHLWADSWRSSFLLPTYSSEADGIAAMRTEAARLGANGLINVLCMDQGHSKWSWKSGPAIICYGNAIRVRPIES